MRASTFFLALVALQVMRPAVAAPSDIKHIVVLMMENRSFDHMLGYLKAENPEIDGLSGDEYNFEKAGDPSSPKVTVSPDAVYVGPAPDHSVVGTTDQVFGRGQIENVYGPTALMDGFVQDLETASPGHGALVMKCFNRTMIPVTSTLATEFGICDKYYASVPGPTEVNRMYAFSCTSHGASTNDNVRLALGYPQETIFNSLDNGGKSWAVYYSDFPTAFFLRKTRDRGMIENFHLLDDLFNDAAAGTLPTFSFVEPRYFHLPDIPANDDHPDHNVRLGELLMKRVYESLRASPLWNSTAFIITNDEHGGFYDHVPTPLHGVPNPDGMNGTEPGPPFDFERLGVRVPFIVASPWVAKGYVMHEATGPTPASHYAHSSIHATLKKMFDLPSFLTKRDEWAGTFEGFFDTVDSPRTDCPEELPTPPIDMSIEESLAIARTPVNDFQQSMLVVVKHLADAMDGEESPDVDVSKMTNEEGAIYVRKYIQRFMQRQRSANPVPL